MHKDALGVNILAVRVNSLAVQQRKQVPAQLSGRNESVPRQTS